MAYPITRLRRLRTNKTMLRMVRENHLSVNDFICPIFVCPGSGIKRHISSIEGCFHYSPDMVADFAKSIEKLSIPAVLLFGLPETKDSQGSDAWKKDSAVNQAIKEIKNACPDLLVITDVCLCAYTDHGHCGTIKDGVVDNDATCQLLARMALSHAQAGADMVAPSDMMDGRVGIIRKTLDDNGLTDRGIMAYSAKFASAFYGPFRFAAESSPGFGDRSTYQMDPANADQAMREIALDIEEGADIIMVKPALPYLDIIARARQRFDLPIAAYNVSGEYMMINAAAKAGLADYEKTMLETLMCIKRAGANMIITYFAQAAAKLLNE